MMNQPELGKKIAELRKLKGLTQEELVDRCNVSIRTLQRIEYGEVIPRASTLKLIFEALEYRINNPLETGLKVEKGWLLKRLGQFYRIILDLFNLKTHTMKKITFLTIMLLAIVFGVVGLVSEIRAEKGNKITLQKNDNIKKKDQLQNGDPVFSDFTAYGCFEENNELIGRDIKLRLNGVNVNVKLLKLNKTTREFNANFVKGTLYQNKVEVTVTPDEINDKLVRYDADNVDVSEEKILLRGNATLTSKQNDSIKTDVIIISLK